MKIKIRKMPVNKQLGTNGIDLDVYENSGTRLGDLRIGKARLTWCKGKTTIPKGKVKTWDDLIAWFEAE